MRKKIGILQFVDRSRFKEGVSFDAKHQILHFAKNDKKIDTTILSKAITDAGFTPVVLYTLKNKKISSTSLSSE